MDDKYMEKELGKLATRYNNKQLPSALDNQTRMRIREKSKKRIAMGRRLKLKTLGAIPAVAILVLVGFVSTFMVLHFLSPAGKFVLNHQELELEVGHSVVLQVVDSDEEITWISSDSRVAEVDELGEVKAISPGIAVITATSGEKSASCTVTVVPANVNIAIVPDNVDLEVGETLELYVETSPQNLEVGWSSQNPSIVTVDQKGSITAMGPGTTKIVASAGGSEAISNVTVTEPGQAALHLNKEKVTELHLLPTANNLSFSPHGNMFVYYTAALGDTATLMDLQGNEFELPSHGEPHFGPVSWYGEKLVYHVLNIIGEASEISGAIYVYNTRSHTYTRITGEGSLLEPSGMEDLKPVLIDEDTIAIVLIDGLWTYNMRQQQWTQKSQFPSEYWGEHLHQISWSPDFTKVAWIDQNTGQDGGVASDRLVVMDVETGEMITLLDSTTPGLTSISTFSWHEDSKFLAASSRVTPPGTTLITFDLEGDSVFYHQGDSFISPLNWIPGQTKLSFNSDGLIIFDPATRKQWILQDISPNHAWLPDGRLAHVGGYVETNDGERMLLEIFEIHWND